MRIIASALLVAGALSMVGLAAHAQSSVYTYTETTREVLDPLYIHTTEVQPAEPVIIHRTIEAPAVVAPVVHDPIIMTQPMVIRDTTRRSLLDINLPFFHFGLF